MPLSIAIPGWWQNFFNSICSPLYVPSEARLARVEEFDLEQKRWEVPWQRMKNRLPHSIPLSDQAVALIETLRRQHNYPFVFHGRDPDKPLSDNAALVF